MKFFDLANRRFSVRGYTDKPVEAEKLDYILQCARLAPSAANRQPCKVYIVKDPTVREKLVSAYKREWLASAPLILVFAGIKGKNWIRSDGTDYLMCDVTIMADYVVLAAAEQGLGTVHIASFNPEIVSDALGLSPEQIPFLMTPLGYPAEDSTRERKRKDISEWVECI